MKLDKVIAVRTNKTVYRDGHLAIKVFDSDYSKADVLNEALNQARVEETALNIPRLHEVCTVGGKWAIVSDFIPGKTLARLMEENPDRRDEYMDLFVDLQLKMHAQTCPLLGKLKDKMNRKIDETGLDATTRYELHARLQGMPNHKKLCHGDFDPKNIILRDDGEAFILDWSHATQGNASVRMFDTVSLLDFAFDVRNHCVFHRTDAAIFDRGVTPCVVYKLRVEGDANHFHATLLEFFITFVERDQLRRANESEVHWPEEQNGRFTVGVLFEVEVFNDFTVAKNCCSCKIRSRTSYQNHMILL